MVAAMSWVFVKEGTMANTDLPNEEQNRSDTRPLRVGAGVIVGVVSMIMALMVDSGFNRSWPYWARAIWAYALIAGILCAVALVANGFGVVTTKSLASTTNRDDLQSGHSLGALQFFAVYAGTLVIAVGTAIWLKRSYGIDGKRSIEGIGGFLFILAAFNKPWWLYYTFRRLGWFAAIESERAMRIVLGVLGAGLALLALFASKP